MSHIFFTRFQKKPKVTLSNEKPSLEEINTTLSDIRHAWHKWYKNKQKEIPSSIIIKDDNSVNFDYLSKYLGGIPKQKYYQSKETGEIFEEKDAIIAQESDIVQKAVDNYLALNHKLPIIGAEKMVNYYVLLNEDVKFLNKKPITQFYITEHENLISHKPQKKKDT